MWRLVAVVQSILLAANWFLYETWIVFHPALNPIIRTVLTVIFPIVAVSFVAASLLAWRYFNPIVRAFYITSAVWVGLMTFCVFAAALAWFALVVAWLAGIQLPRNVVADALLGFALLLGAYGIFNASRVRVTRIRVKLPNLPGSWHGRVAALVSDMHLGHIRNFGFIRRTIAKLNALHPDVVFIGGDVYDGTVANVDSLAQPWSGLAAPLGAFFVTGNHEEFTSRAKYLQALSRSGVRVLNNEKVEVDGLQIVGVHYREFVDSMHFRAVLQSACIARDRPSVLLAHAPHRLPIVEQAGISLHLCGHTHGGQFPPSSWITSRIYGPYVHGLNRFGRLLVLTSWGVGTWGPPLRLGTHPELVLISFESS